MRMKLITTTAAALALGSMSFAHAATGTTTGTGAAGMEAGQHGTVHDWDDDVADAFFEDDTRVTLRGDDEIESNWDDLDSDQQDLVREYCEGHDEAGATGQDMGQDTTTAADPGTATDDMEPDTETDMTDTQPGMAADPTMAELCDIVEDL